ncbi:class I SAM-dependent methyltransferase [Humibacillus xanthopallidus]|uniref:Methyltransferase family protein n=1 Tax=Humibacillus xanthopallidus TaxID=412689 RepID=A0A543I2M6_9MICO|nr:class I SAM-dependent methyltransferase [Humibacillus xanthopallidus]TQM64849.1 methyltransferase family protein [Humibacillus xanthopallidus]
MTRNAWDDHAATFDTEPDHGLTDPTIRAAWRDLLVSVLPDAPARVADLGCGTGTLTRLLTDEGYVVDGLDFSPEMVERARAKVPEARFVVADAGDPPLPAGEYDVVLSRHVLWAMDDPEEALSRWVALLRPGGVAVLVEGSWATGAGLTAAQTEQLVRAVRDEVHITHLPEPIYWGKAIADERYLAVSRR